MSAARWSDRDVEQVIGRMLQFGVLLAAVVVAVGAAIILAQHGREATNYRVSKPLAMQLLHLR